MALLLRINYGGSEYEPASSKGVLGLKITGRKKKNVLKETYPIYVC